MAGILAIESDRTRQALLKALVGEHTRAEMKMVETVKAAISTFSETKPDVIIAPALLSPADSEELAAYVKAHAEPHVQMLTISALDVLRESAPDEDQRFALFRRRPISLGLQYDPYMVGRQIADRVERARVLRAEYEAAPRSTSLQPTLYAATVVRSVKKTAPAAAGTLPKDRRWAQRTPQQSPWVWTVRLPWGAEVDLVNISRTGVLLESGSKVSPGVALELQLSGVGLHRTVTARFVRSEIARVDRLGVRYHAAAQFDQPLDILPAHSGAATPSTSESLAQLVTSVLSDLNQPETASVRFARGLRGLVRARDVLIRRSPIACPDDAESIYFHVRGDDASQTILQVMFDRDRALTSEEFKLLKAAAGVTVGVLELEQLAEDTRPAGRMSEVA